MEVFFNAYYLFSIVIITVGIHWIFNIQQKILWSSELMELLEKDAEMPNPLRRDAINALYKKTNLQIFIYYIWLFLGFFSSQRLFFPLIIITELIALKSTSKELKLKELAFRRRLGYIIELIIITFIYVNHLFGIIIL